MPLRNGDGNLPPSVFTGEVRLMSEDLTQVSIMVPQSFADWLRSEAARTQRSVSFVARRLLLREQVNRQVDAAENIDDVAA